jgi:hypothetical protein
MRKKPERIIYFSTYSLKVLIHMSHHIVLETLNLQAKRLAEYTKQKENHSDIRGSQSGVAKDSRLLEF